MTPITRKLSIVSLSNLNIANTAGARNSSSRVRVGVDLGSYNIICLLNIDITHIIQAHMKRPIVRQATLIVFVDPQLLISLFYSLRVKFILNCREICKSWEDDT
jgi:hypothetical protein